MSVSARSAAFRKPSREYCFEAPHPDGEGNADVKFKSSRKNQKVFQRDKYIPAGNAASPFAVERIMLGSVSGRKGNSFVPSFYEDKDVLEWLFSVAEESPSARLLLKSAQEQGWNISLEDMGEGALRIDLQARGISLNHYGFKPHALGQSLHFRNAVLYSFLKALRHVWHQTRAGLLHEKRPEAVLMLGRAKAADSETIAILCGWELRAAGHHDLWRHILGSDEGDMAMIFTRALEKNPAGFYDGSVLAQTFCQWYGDDTRLAAADHETLEWMDGRLKASLFGKPFGAEGLKGRDIEGLCGQASYLKGMGETVVSDPYFAALKDPVNEAHLFQIICESQIFLVEGVPFRDRKLARMIFPA
jgi:hypothetical protein